jgi:hypothetical protein
MDNASFWLDTANIITSIATLGALIAVAIEIRSSRVADKRGASFELAERFVFARKGMDILNQAGREDFDGFYEEYPAGSKEYSALVDLYNFFEYVGEASFSGLIDLERAIEEYGNIASHWWRAFKHTARQNQSIRGREKHHLYFEWFALQAIKNEPRTSEKVIKALEKLRREFPV